MKNKTIQRIRDIIFGAIIIPTDWIIGNQSLKEEYDKFKRENQ